MIQLGRLYTVNRKDGRAIREWLPHDLWWSDNQLKDPAQFERLLSRVVALSLRAWYFGGAQYGRDWDSFKEAQAVLERFRKVADEMRRFCPGDAFDRHLREAEGFFNVNAGAPVTSPLFQPDGSPVQRVPLKSGRHRDDWKPGAIADLRNAGRAGKVTLKDAARVVATIDEAIRTALDTRPKVPRGKQRAHSRK